MTELMFRDSNTPAAAPTATPTPASSRPWAIKIAITERALAPMVRSTAISERFSVTAMVRVEMILKAATATTLSSSTVIMVFSMRMAEKRLPWERPQSRTL